MSKSVPGPQKLAASRLDLVAVHCGAFSPCSKHEALPTPLSFRDDYFGKQKAGCLGTCFRLLSSLLVMYLLNMPMQMTLASQINSEDQEKLGMESSTRTARSPLPASWRPTDRAACS